jgi:glutaredoxin
MRCYAIRRHAAQRTIIKGLYAMEPMKQQCYLVIVWSTWLLLPALSIGMGFYAGWWAGIIVLLAGVFGQIYYLKMFPRMSRMLGYGTVEDVAAEASVQTRVVSRVTLYTASVCPFCPIVKRRLIELRRSLGFELVEIDITFQPGLNKDHVIVAERYASKMSRLGVEQSCCAARTPNKRQHGASAKRWSMADKRTLDWRC